MKDIFIAVIASGTITTLVQFLITFIFSRKDKSKEIESKIDALTENLDEHKATLARTHILRFADEQRSGVIKHSEEYFKQTILDIDVYDKYCDRHPDFQNGLTVLASEYIKDEFRKLYTGGDDSK